MKRKAVIVGVLLLVTVIGHSQKKQTTYYMIITITNKIGYEPKKLTIITTLDSKPQELKEVILTAEGEKEYDILTLKILKPHFDAGWKLVSTSSSAHTAVSGGESFNQTFKTAKYFLSKSE
jgi:hypothetical protein